MEIRNPLNGIGFPFGQWFLLVALAALAGAGIAVRRFRAEERARVGLVRVRLGAVARAADAYYVDHEAYPACGAAAGVGRIYESQQIWQPVAATRIETGVATINSFAPEDSGARRLVTFRIGEAWGGDQTGGGLATMTTPVAYLPRFEADPFANTTGASFGYFAHASNLGYILFSLGPDRDEGAADGPGQISPRVERLYDISNDFPYMWRPAAGLVDCGYDPSNGLMSRGDLYVFQGQ